MPDPTPAGSSTTPAAPVTPVATEKLLYPNTPSGQPPVAPATPPPATPPSQVPPVAPATPPVTPPAEPPVVPPVVPPEPPKGNEPPKEPAKAPGQPPANPAPTEYDLKLPDGSLLSADDVAEVVKEAKASNLTPEKAKELLLAKDQLVRKGAAAIKTQQEQAFDTVRNQWKEQVKADPELGGEHLAETAILANRALEAFASPKLKEFVVSTRLGDHPEWTRMMVKIGKLIGEDGLVRGSTVTPPAPQTREAKLYGKTTPDGSGKIPA